MLLTGNVLYIIQIKGASIIYVAGLDGQNQYGGEDYAGHYSGAWQMSFFEHPLAFLLVSDRGLS